MNALEKIVKEEVINMAKEITWSGRLFIDEQQITPEQYKMFFGRSEFGIRYSAANSILKSNSSGDYDEIVPGHELNEETTDTILYQFLYDEGYKTVSEKAYTETDAEELYIGTVQHEGFTLHWRWEPEIVDENDKPVSFKEANNWAKRQVLTQMLKEKSGWGRVYL